LSLADFGWNAVREGAFAVHAAAGLVPGRVVLEHNHVFRVRVADSEILAESAGRMKHRAEGRQALPVVGDWVAVRLDTVGTRSQIREVLPRTTWFSRKAAGRETEEQIVAANIDVVFIVFGLDIHVKSNAIERYLVLARRSGATPVIVLNKSDVVDDAGPMREDAEQAAAGAPVHVISARTAEPLSALEAYFAPGRTIALLGPSGVGKSSIVNRLIGNEVLPTGEVREWDSRGRHTTVHRQLVARARGGLVIDTPGMRELQLWDTDVVDAFDDIAALAAGCRFRDCLHDREPGCAVKAAMERGQLDDGRYASFIKLQAEQLDMEKRRDERALNEAKRSGKIGSKALKALQKERQKEGRES
ncbi:MAG: ribosome small subunit-dependent GTPase A, partial [Acidobacteriota bacterium]